MSLRGTLAQQEKAAAKSEGEPCRELAAALFASFAATDRPLPLPFPVYILSLCSRHYQRLHQLR